ncbi:LysR family transcriptional regulator [Nocardia sp. CA-135398]|uniref:LysR family transcriptional regulator n=1 Tax=Nocardia sp. CA-135398 TaxID=3239977 RepID=UPI003D97213A
MAELNPAALRAFVAVAEQLHFGRAAGGLYLTTPALSQQISRLEKSLGTPLFERSSRKVELTTAGQQLLPLAREAVAAHERIAAWRTRRNTPSLQIGFMHAGPGKLTADIFAAAFQRFPAARLEFKQVHRDNIPDALRSGELDAAFLWGPYGFDGIHTDVLWREPRVALLHADSALARLPRDLRASDLRDEPIVLSDSVDPGYIAWCAIDPRPDGSRPVLGPRTHSIEEALATVAAHYGVYLLPRCVAETFGHANIVHRPVIDLAPSPFTISVVDRGSSTLARELVQVATEISDQASSPTKSLSKANYTEQRPTARLITELEGPPRREYRVVRDR